MDQPTQPSRVATGNSLTRIAFIYLSSAPRSTAKRIERFAKSITAANPSATCHIVSYVADGQAGTADVTFGEVSVRRHIYNRDSLRDLPYPNKAPHGPFTFNEGYVDLPIILFWREHPEFDRYWVCEDDVEYTGDIGHLLRHLDRTHRGTNLSCTHLRLLPENWITPGISPRAKMRSRPICRGVSAFCRSSVSAPRR